MLYQDLDKTTNEIHGEIYTINNTTYIVNRIIYEKYKKIADSNLHHYKNNYNFDKNDHGHDDTVNIDSQINQPCNICKLETQTCIHRRQNISQKPTNLKIKITIKNKSIHQHPHPITNTTKKLSQISEINSQNSYQTQQQKKQTIQLYIPSIFQLQSKQLPKIIIEQIFTSYNTKLQNFYNNHSNEIKVDKICVNPYLNYGGLKWLLYKIPENYQEQEEEIEVLYREQGKITIKDINYFSNIGQYEQYFKFTEEEIEKFQEFKLQNIGEEQYRYILFGVCQNEVKYNMRVGEREKQGQNKKDKIIALYLWIYQWNNQEQKYQLYSQIRLKANNRTTKQQIQIKQPQKQQQQLKDKDKFNMNIDNHLQISIDQNQNITNTAQIDNTINKIPATLSLSLSHNPTQIQKHNKQIQFFPTLNIPWQGNIDLQYKLRNLQNKLLNFQSPIPTPTNSHEDIYTHYLIRFSIKKANKFMLIVYNRQKMCIDIFEYLQYLWNAYLQENKKEMCRKELKQILIRELQWLEQPLGLAYPIKYYLDIFYLYHRIQRRIREEEDEDEDQGRYYNCMIENSKLEIDRRKQFRWMSMQNKIKLCKYMLIQNIRLEEIFYNNNKRNNNNQNNSNITPQIAPPPYVQNIKIQKILKLDNSLLQQNPTNNTIIIYWIVGLPGSLKTQIYSEINQLLQPFSVYTLHLSDISQKQKIQKFISLPSLFFNERFAFCFMDSYYSVEKMKQFTVMLSTILPKDLYYELILISPQKQQKTIFYSQIDTQYKTTQQSPQPTYRKIQTTYNFSIDYMIGCLLNIQKKPYNKKYPQNLYGQGTESLAKMLHFISNNYSNIDLQSMVRKYHIIRGKIKILYYSTKQKVSISWNNINQYERQEIQDQMKVLLQLSYKEVIRQDMLLAYFLENLENLEYCFEMDGLGGQILERTFQVLPYFSQDSDSN